MQNDNRSSLFRNLSSGTRDEEPLVDAWVNWSWRKGLVLWNRRKLVRGDTAGRVLDSEVGAKSLSIWFNKTHEYTNLR